MAKGDRFGSGQTGGGLASRVERPRLLGIFESAARQKLTLLVAPAGYGKTTLMRQWERAAQDLDLVCAWLSVRAVLARPASIWNAIASALQTGGLTAPRKRNESGLDLVLDMLQAEQRHVLLFIDDAQCLAPDAISSLALLLESTPISFSVVAASRSTLPSMSRLRAADQVVEIGRDALAFTDAEATALLERRAETISQEQAKGIISVAEGWAVGIVALAQRHDASNADAVQGLATRSHLDLFFDEEVLAPLPSDVTDFLVRTAPLERFNAELSDFALGIGDSAARIHVLQNLGLFIAPVEENGDWFRYQPLFAEYLIRKGRRMPGVPLGEIMNAGSKWYERRGEIHQACKLAIDAGAIGRAARLLNGAIGALTTGGRTRRTVQLAQSLPFAELSKYPSLLLSIAWLRSTEWQFEAASEAISEVTSKIQSLTSSGGSPVDVAGLRDLLLLQRMMLGGFSDDMATVEKNAQLLLQDVDRKDQRLVAMAHGLTMLSDREHFRLKQAMRQARKLDDWEGSAENSYSALWHNCIKGPTLFLMGHISDALAECEAAMTLAQQFVQSNPRMMAAQAMLAAEMYYERNDLTAARRLMNTYVRGLPHGGFVDQTISGHLVTAQLHAIDGNLAAADEVLSSGARLAERHGFNRMKFRLLSEHVRILSISGGVDRALWIGEEAELPKNPEDCAPRRRLSGVDEARAFAWVRLAQLSGRASEALALARRWRDPLASAGAARAAMRWDIQIAQLHVMLEERKLAMRALRRAIEQASHERFVRSFLDEGELVRALLADQAVEGGYPPGERDVFVRHLLEAEGNGDGSLPKGAEQSSVGLKSHLSGRELELLRLAGHGLRNKEIALKFGMTEGTVKWYFQGLFDKLGTRRRAGLIQRARQLGLIRWQ